MEEVSHEIPEKLPNRQQTKCRSMQAKRSDPEKTRTLLFPVEKRVEIATEVAVIRITGISNR